MTAPQTREVQTPHGAARIVQRRAPRPWASLVLTHGAGAGVGTHDLDALLRRLPGRGISVTLIEQPWVAAGRRIAPAPRVLDEGFVAAANTLRPQTPMFVGGRSAGARVACRTARGLGAVGVVALAFPLHPPRKPDKSRVAELAGARVPILVVQGERDALGLPEEFPVQTRLVRVPDADHSFKIRGTEAADVGALLADAVGGWLAEQLGRTTTG